MASPIIQASASRFDVITESLTGSVAVVFCKTRGSGYDAGVNFAKQVARYDEASIGKSQFHFAVFDRTREQAALALALIRNMRSTKGLQIIAGGKLIQDWLRVDAVLSCYLNASALSDYRAHCVEMIHESHLIERFLSRESRAVVPMQFGSIRVSKEYSGRVVAFPCRYIRSKGFRFQLGHPASAENQLQGASIREGCDWCPNFKPDRDR